MSRATSFIVCPANCYGDDVSSYIPAATRAAVEAELVDYGYIQNPAVFVYKVTKGEGVATKILELSLSPDPYPDFVVERGPRGGVQWNRA